MKRLAITVALGLAAVAGVQAQERNVRGVLGVGVTGGGDTLATVVYTDGSTDSIKSGGLVHLFGGAEFRLGTQVTMQATVGYHVDETNGASDGAGARFVNNAKIDSGGVLSGARVDFDNTVGAVIEGEWMVTPSIGLKLRYVNETYKGGGVSVDADHGGFYFSWYL
jgi:hypothetical protein